MDSVTVIPLGQLPLRVCAVIRRIDTEQEGVERLKALGLCIGRQVELVQNGDPLIVRVFGSRLGISSRLANCVYVESCAGNCAAP